MKKQSKHIFIKDESDFKISPDILKTNWSKHSQ